MKYVGMYTQVSRNNKLTIMLLLLFPALTLLMVWLFYVLLTFAASHWTAMPNRLGAT